METVEVGVPEEVLALLKRSRLGDRPVQEQVRVALAIHLFQEGVSSLSARLHPSQASRAPTSSCSWLEWASPPSTTTWMTSSKTVKRCAMPSARAARSPTLASNYETTAM